VNNRSYNTAKAGRKGRFMTSTLQSPVSDLKGVGEEKQRELEQLGIATIDDLLHHFPYRY
jgi:ATP-dependent DNA helicase RecG